MSVEQVVTNKRGGARVGAGRPKGTKGGGRPKKIFDEALFTEECLLPAFCKAFNAEPGQFKNRYLTVELSKIDIKTVYGAEGLKRWCDVFSLEKIGGRDRNGVGYKTRWCLKLGCYTIVKALVEQSGYNIKMLPIADFPPPLMQRRLDELEAKRVVKRLAKELK